MKRKIILTLAIMAVLALTIALTVGAEAPSMYIEFGVKLSGSESYVPAYVETTSSGDPTFNLNNSFYPDLDFTEAIDKTTIVGIDFSDAKPVGTKTTYVKQVTKANDTSVYKNCAEVKWFNENVTTTSNNTFANWTGLKYFDFGCITAIDYGFLNSTGIEEIVVPAQVTKLYNGVFQNCASLKSVKIEGVLTTMGINMFQNCTSLKNVDLGANTLINETMFKGCSALESITIPSTVTEIKGSAFTDCVLLKSIDVSSVTTFGNSVFQGCSALESVKLGDVSVIGENMFYNCKALKNINIPTTITTVKKNAFYNCVLLTSFDFSNVTTIGDSAFYGCAALTSVKLGQVSSIPSNLFYGCKLLSDFTIPSSVTSIGGNAFRDCAALTSATIPEGVTSLGHCAFYKAGITSLHIPAGVTTIGYQLAEETPIQSLTFAEGSQLKFIDHRAFMSCKSLAGVVILPDGLEEIDYGIFSNCSSLKAVKFPDSLVRYTENKAMFTSCSSLEFVQLSKNVDTIPGSMFENCSSLKAICIPEGVKHIGSKAIRNCKSLQAIYLPSTLETMGIISTSTDQGAFYQSTYVYFVQEAFEVFDGDTLIGDSFVMPSKPDVYYMPAGLTRVGNSEFQDCKTLNRCIVFPEGVTSASGCTQGAFQNVGSASNPVTIVFMGDMESIQIIQNSSSYSNISFLFANPNDVDISSVTFTISSHKDQKNQTNTYMYFCAGNVVYDLSTFKAPASTLYTVSDADFTKTSNTEATQPHVADPRKDAVVDADCVTDILLTTYCFCGDKAGATPGEGTNLGHSHTVFMDMVYESFLSDGYIVYKCERCDDENDDTVAKALFACLGYSSPEKDGRYGIVLDFNVNAKAIELYKELTGNTFEYGMFAVSKNALGTNDMFDASGSLTAGGIKAKADSTDYTGLSLKITGFETEAQIKAYLALGAYVAVTDSENKTSYFCMQDGTPNANDKYSFISLYDILNPKSENIEA